MSWNAIFRGAQQGMQLGDQVVDAVNDFQIAKIRAQGIAEAKAQQAASTPGVTDIGDAQNLTSRPQASADPNAAPVNTDLQASPAMQPAAEGAPLPAPTNAAEGMSTVPVPAPMAQDTTKLSSTPMASAPMQSLAATPTPAATGLSIKGGKRFQVGDASFDTADEAHDFAAKSAKPLDEILRTTLVPKLKEQYIKQGDIAKADAWDKWAQEGENKAYMKNWSKAYQAAQAGDWDSAADQLTKLHGEFADGYTVTGREKVKDKDGNVTGFQITAKNDVTGGERTQVIDPKSLVEMGLGGLSPDKQFALRYQRQTQADTLAAKSAISDNKERQVMGRQLAVEGEKTKRSDSRNDASKDRQEAHDEAVSERTKRDIAARTEAKGKQIDQTFKLRAEEISRGMKFKKGDDPDAIKARLLTKMIADPMFQMKSPEKQKEARDHAYDLLPDSVKNGGGSGAAGGMSVTPKPKPAPQFRTDANGVPVY